MTYDLIRDERNGFYATGFWGGREHGRMVQLTVAPVRGKADGDLTGYDPLTNSLYISVSLRRFRAMLRQAGLNGQRHP